MLRDWIRVILIPSDWDFQIRPAPYRQVVEEEEGFIGPVQHGEEEEGAASTGQQGEEEVEERR
ncbi:hypothetical protein EYF80_028044 [Liparis tanakae]|uniref:Uncharacterized protein n=1 Tax=Liparis tanakae TaxID=230148 RepID=A0A4Z2H912_9TELE|nr:hypothetical protein EYF80_028044 [Liparis tanakae]